MAERLLKNKPRKVAPKKPPAEEAGRAACPHAAAALVGTTVGAVAKRKKEAAVEVVESVENELFKNVRAILAKARAAVYTAANTAMVEAYWNVGREIVEKQGGASRAKYGEGLINALALRLTTEFGDGFTVPNLRNMRQFYLTFPKRYALRSELSWTHYRILMRVESNEARDYYFESSAEFLAGEGMEGIKGTEGTAETSREFQTARVYPRQRTSGSVG